MFQEFLQAGLADGIIGRGGQPCQFLHFFACQGKLLSCQLFRQVKGHGGNRVLAYKCQLCLADLRFSLHLRGIKLCVYPGVFLCRIFVFMEKAEVTEGVASIVSRLFQRQEGLAVSDVVGLGLSPGDAGFQFILNVDNPAQVGQAVVMGCLHLQLGMV